MWLIIALIGFTIAATVNVMDKYILDKTIKKSAVFVFYSTAPAIIILLLLPWTNNLHSNWDIIFAVLAGSSFVFSLWACYQGIQKSEVSHIGPLIGAVTPIFVIIWSLIFFNEIFTTKQIFAITSLIFGSFIIASEKSVKNNGFHSGFAWGILGGFLGSIFGITSKYLYGVNDFLTGFVWVQGMVGIFGLLMIFSFHVRQSLKKKPKKEKLGAKKIAFIVFDKTLGVVVLVLIQYAVALGSAAIVYALAGVQYALLVIFVAILSKVWPKFYREEYSKVEVVQEIIAVLFIACGLALLV